MAGLRILSRVADRFAARSPQGALAQANRLAKIAPERAFALFVVAAEAGDSLAAFMVGECFAEGKGTPRNTYEAARWFHRAATEGHVDAQCRLAQLHLSGLPKDAVTAAVGLFEAVEP